MGSLLIAGPTASGKSALALEVAARLPGAVVINCDSMQVYRDLSILTARPDADDMRVADHLLYGHRDGALLYSMAQWRDEVRDVLARTGDAPKIFVGGTGLYFRMLTDGISPIPDVPDAVREDVRARMERLGAPALHDQLDPVMADQLSPTDSQRVARALEVLLATGKSLADWQALPPDGGLLSFHQEGSVVLAPPRDWLEVRIRQRAGQMLSEEALEEVRVLMERNLATDLPVMRAIGVSVAHAYVQGDMSRSEALESLSVQTRRYAKRQGTWFRGQMGHWPRFDPSAGDMPAFAEHLAQSVDV